MLLARAGLAPMRLTRIFGHTAWLAVLSYGATERFGADRQSREPILASVPLRLRNARKRRSGLGVDKFDRD